MKWRMPFITLLLGCGIAQADFLAEVSPSRRDDYAFKLDFGTTPPQTGVHYQPISDGALPAGGLGISMNSRFVRDWYRSIEEPRFMKTSGREVPQEAR